MAQISIVPTSAFIPVSRGGRETKKTGASCASPHLLNGLQAQRQGGASRVNVDLSQVQCAGVKISIDT